MNMFKKYFLWIFVLILSISCVNAAITDNVIAWWVIDNRTGDPLYDFSGNDLNLSNNGASFISNTEGYDFDGTNDFLNRSAISAVGKASDYTVSMWFKSDLSATTDRMLFTNFVGSSDRTFLKIESDFLAVGSYEGAYDYVEVAFSDTTNWHHVILLGGSGSYTGYLDGTLFNDASMSVDGVAGNVLTIGSSGASYFWDGHIKNVVLFNKTLNSSEIALLNSSGKDYNPYVNLSNIDLIFSNKSDASNSKDSFNEGEDFYSFINWTDSSGYALNDSVGSCNITHGSTVYSAIYNSSLNLWISNESFSFSDAGNQTFSGNCSHNSDSNLDNDITENITILNIPPVVILNSVNTDLGVTAISEGVLIEYADGLWYWNISVIDDDEDTINISWYNSSGSMLESVQQSASANNILNSSDELFLLFENPFNVTVWVNDSDGNTTTISYNFNVTDTTDPSITITLPINNSNYNADRWINFSTACTDEGLYKFEMLIWDKNGSLVGNDTRLNLNGSDASNVSAINSSIFSISANTDEQHNITLTCSDSHTVSELMENPVIDNNGNQLDFNFDKGLVRIVSSDAQSIDFNRITDRYIISSIADKERNSFSFLVYADKIDVIGNSDYECHAVLNEKYWVDFEGDNVDNCIINSNSNGVMEVTVNTRVLVKELVSRSVGEINTVSIFHYFSTYTPADINWTGIICSEKYPYNTFTLNFSQHNLSNCKLRVNGNLWARNWSEDCGSVDLTFGIGKQSMVLSADNQPDNYCVVWTDKINRELADYVWILIYAALIILLFWAGMKFMGLFTFLAGVVTCLLAAQLMFFDVYLALLVGFVGLAFIGASLKG